MIWIFDQLVASRILTKKEAGSKLTELVNTNFIFQNNRPLVAEIEKKISQ